MKTVIKDWMAKLYVKATYQNFSRLEYETNVNKSTFLLQIDSIDIFTLF